MTQEKVKIDIAPKKNKYQKQKRVESIKKFFKKKEPIDEEKFRMMLDKIDNDNPLDKKDNQVVINIPSKKESKNEFKNEFKKEINFNYDKKNNSNNSNYKDEIKKVKDFFNIKLKRNDLEEEKNSKEYEYDINFQNIDNRIRNLRDNVRELDLEIKHKVKSPDPMDQTFTKEDKLKAEEIRELNESIDTDIESLSKLEGMKDLFEHLKSMKNYIENHDLKLRSFDTDITDLKLIKSEIRDIKRTLLEKTPIKDDKEDKINVLERIANLELRSKISDKTINSMISDVELELKKNMEDVHGFMTEYKEKINIVNDKLNILLDNKEKIKVIKKNISEHDEEFHRILKEIHKTFIMNPEKYNALSLLYDKLCETYKKISKYEKNEENLEYYYDKIVSWHKKLSS